MKMILDLDTGIDDAMALAYALGHDDIELLGVTTTYGNVSVDDSAHNTLNLLELCQKTDVPVYCGEDTPLESDVFHRADIVRHIHGENGVGNVELNVAERDIESMSAVSFLIESIRTYRAELVIVSTGPETNIASAINQAPDIKKIMGRVIVMGGALTVPGNVSAFAEANIAKDPLAAKTVFESDIDVTMVGLDVTQRPLLTTDQTKQWRDTSSMAGNVYAEMADYYIQQQAQPSGCPLHDPSAVIQAVHPEWFSTLPLHMKIITDGEASGRQSVILRNYVKSILM